MSHQDLLPGNRFRLYRRAGGAPVFFCLAVTQSFQRSNDFEDATTNDCDGPVGDIPWRKSVKRVKMWNLSFSGKVDASKMQVVRDDCDAELAIEYEVKIEPANGNGGGSWIGNIHYENLEVGKQEQGLVTFSVTARGDGPVGWTDA